ncbi:MAG: ketopantoate reductase family protein [Planctomycetes bacterium]|nr:ketopantoate reductase family protein [Planctomycetota bacterium]
MRIAVLGAGAMGTTLGAFLTRAGHTPLLVDASREHVAALQSGGARISGCCDLVVPVQAALPDRVEGVFDSVFLFVKQTRTAEALAAFLPHLHETGVVCTLQNGFPEPLVAKTVGPDRTVGGACLWGATFAGPGHAVLTNDLDSREYLFEIGECDGAVTPRIQAVASVLEGMGPVIITDNLTGARWMKLMLNASMSGLSSALGCPFGDILDNDKALTCLSYLAREVVRVCAAAGATMASTNNLDPAAIAGFTTRAELERSKGYLFRNYDNLRTAKASMLQDLEAGRETEVAMINGHVCETGRRLGVATPYNDLVRDLITAAQAGNTSPTFTHLDRFSLPELR